MGREIIPEAGIFSGFRWPVAIHGYRVAALQYSKDEDPQLSIVDDCPEGAKYRWCLLTKYPELYRTFAAIDAENPESILAFANKYGILDYKIFTLTNTITPMGNYEKRERKQHGNPLSLWKREIGPMQAAVQLWNNLKKEKNNEWLEKRILWKGKDRFVYKADLSHPPYEEFSWPPYTVNAKLRAEYEKRSYPVLGLYILQRTINEHL